MYIWNQLSKMGFSEKEFTVNWVIAFSKQNLRTCKHRGVWLWHSGMDSWLLMDGCQLA